MSERVKITIVGAGIIGCAVAWRLSKTHGDVFILEKNPRILSDNQSSRNSGVIHAGIYYPADESPLKSKLCLQGNPFLYAFCEEFGVPCRQTGKLVLAVNEGEFEYLEDTMRIARASGVPGARIICAEEVKALEPNAACLRAAFFPTSGIVESTQLVYKLYSLASEQGAFFLPATSVVDVKPGAETFTVTARTAAGNVETFESEVVIDSAGVYANEIARLVDSDCPWEILPVRGESAKFYKTRRPDIGHARHNIYPVPHGIGLDGRKIDASFADFKKLYREKKVLKTVGVHLTPTFDLIDGRYEIGSTVTIGPATGGGLSKEDLSTGLFPPEHFHRLVHPFFPGLLPEDIELHQAGIQAKIKGYHDYVIEPDPEYPRFIRLIGIDSPGLTASLAIARMVEDLVAAVG